MALYSDTTGSDASMDKTELQPPAIASAQVRLPKHADNPLVMLDGGPAVAPVLEAYKTLRTKLLKAQSMRGIRSVVVASAAPGDGKTITTFNLACGCAQLQGSSVLMIDGDLRSRGLTRLMSGLPSAGLSEVLGGSSTCTDVIARTDVSNLYVLGAGANDVSPIELFSSSRWSDVMAWAGAEFKLVLVDSPPIVPTSDFELIAGACDGWVLVTRSRSTPRTLLQSALDQADPQKLLGVIWNGASEQSSGYKS